MRIYIGNLSSDVLETELRRVFQAFGLVTFVNMIHEEAGSFALLGMPVKQEGRMAIASLHGKQMKGKPIQVTEAGVQSISGERHSLANALVRWEFYKDNSDRWQWRKFKGGKVVTVSSDGFPGRKACVENAATRGYVPPSPKSRTER